jgi:hypothetical protein
LEFAYNRVRVPHPYLWRQADLRSYMERRLTTSLLSVCSQQPQLLVCLANEVSTSLFSQGIQLEVPVVRVSELPPSRRHVDLKLVRSLKTSMCSRGWPGSPPHPTLDRRRACPNGDRRIGRA